VKNREAKTADQNTLIFLRRQLDRLKNVEDHRAQRSRGEIESFIRRCENNARRSSRQSTILNTVPARHDHSREALR